MSEIGGTLRGRKPVPTALKRLMGNPGHRPLNDHEPQPDRPASVEPPGHLAEDARGCWLELIPQLDACGLLTALDLVKLEVLCIHMAAHRRLYRNINACLALAEKAGRSVDTSQPLRALRQEAEVIKSLSAGFGLDPADRVRLNVAPQPTANDPFAEFEHTSLHRFLHAGRARHSTAVTSRNVMATSTDAD